MAYVVHCLAVASCRPVERQGPKASPSLRSRLPCSTSPANVSSAEPTSAKAPTRVCALLASILGHNLPRYTCLAAPDYCCMHVVCFIHMPGCTNQAEGLPSMGPFGCGAGSLENCNQVLTCSVEVVSNKCCRADDKLETGGFQHKFPA